MNIQGPRSTTFNQTSAPMSNIEVSQNVDREQVYNAPAFAENTDTVGTQLGRQGYQAMYHPSLKYGKEQARIGGSYLSSINSQSDVYAEKVVSHTAISAYNSVGTWRGQVAVASVALNAMAAGVSGPLGATLAKVGYDSMYDPAIEKVRDQASIGIRFTESLATYGNDQEKNGANAALNASRSVATVRAQATLFSDFLS